MDGWMDTDKQTYTGIHVTGYCHLHCALMFIFETTSNLWDGACWIKHVFTSITFVFHVSNILHFAENVCFFVCCSRGIVVPVCKCRIQIQSLIVHVLEKHGVQNRLQYFNKLKYEVLMTQKGIKSQDTEQEHLSLLIILISCFTCY